MNQEEIQLKTFRTSLGSRKQDGENVMQVEAKKKNDDSSK